MRKKLVPHRPRTTAQRDQAGRSASTAEPSQTASRRSAHPLVAPSRAAVTSGQRGRENLLDQTTVRALRHSLFLLVGYLAAQTSHMIALLNQVDLSGLDPLVQPQIRPLPDCYPDCLTTFVQTQGNQRAQAINDLTAASYAKFRRDNSGYINNAQLHQAKLLRVNWQSPAQAGEQHAEWGYVKNPSAPHQPLHLLPENIHRAPAQSDAHLQATVYQGAMLAQMAPALRNIGSRLEKKYPEKISETQLLTGLTTALKNLAFPLTADQSDSRASTRLMQTPAGQPVLWSDLGQHLIKTLGLDVIKKLVYGNEEIAAQRLYGYLTSLAELPSPAVLAPD